MSEGDLHPRGLNWWGSRTASTTTSDEDIRLAIVSNPSKQLANVATEQEAIEWARARIAPLRNLPADWDSYGAEPIDPRAAARAERLIADLLIARVPAPEALPSPDSGITLEWHRPGLGLVILVPSQADGVASAYFHDDAGAEWDMPTLSDDQFAVSLRRLQEATT